MRQSTLIHRPPTSPPTCPPKPKPPGIVLVGGCGPLPWRLALLTVAFVLALAAAVFGGMSECVDATCRVSCGDAVGSGIVIERSPTTVWVVTNAHVATSDRPSCEFWRSGHKSRPIKGTTLIRDKATDVALIAIPTLAFGGNPPPAVPLGTAADMPSKGATVMSVGCANGAWATGWKGHSLGYPSGTKELRFTPSPAGGRSGSAVFDSTGNYVVGLIRARVEDASGGSEGIAIPAPIIRTTLAALRQQISGGSSNRQSTGESRRLGAQIPSARRSAIQTAPGRTSPRRLTSPGLPGVALPLAADTSKSLLDDPFADRQPGAVLTGTTWLPDGTMRWTPSAPIGPSARSEDTQACPPNGCPDGCPDGSCQVPPGQGSWLPYRQQQGQYDKSQDGRIGRLEAYPTLPAPRQQYQGERPMVKVDMQPVVDAVNSVGTKLDGFGTAFESIDNKLDTIIIQTGPVLPPDPVDDPEPDPAVVDALADQNEDIGLLAKAIEVLAGDTSTLAERMDARLAKVEAENPNATPAEIAKAYALDYGDEKAGQIGWLAGTTAAEKLGLGGFLATIFGVGGWVLAKVTYKDFRDKAETGDPLMIEKLLSRLSNFGGGGQQPAATNVTYVQPPPATPPPAEAPAPTEPPAK